MASGEKMDSNQELAELKKDEVRKAINLLRLQWNDLHSHLDSSQSYLEERFTLLQSREKCLLSIQESVADSNKHLDSIRQSVEERDKEIEHKHHEFLAFQEQHLDELKLKEKQLDLMRKSVEERIKEMELREEKLIAHQTSFEGFFEKLNLEMKQFQNIEKSSDGKKRKQHSEANVVAHEDADVDHFRSSEVEEDIRLDGIQHILMGLQKFITLDDKRLDELKLQAETNATLRSKQEKLLPEQEDLKKANNQLVAEVSKLKSELQAARSEPGRGKVEAKIEELACFKKKRGVVKKKSKHKRVQSLTDGAKSLPGRIQPRP